MHDPRTGAKGGIAGGNEVLDGGGQREKSRDNCNSIINKIYLKEKEEKR